MIVLKIDSTARICSMIVLTMPIIGLVLPRFVHQIIKKTKHERKIFFVIIIIIIFFVDFPHFSLNFISIN